MLNKCDDSLTGVDTPTIHRMGCTLVQGGCDESLEGVDPSTLAWFLQCVWCVFLCSESPFSPLCASCAFIAALVVLW